MRTNVNVIVVEGRVCIDPVLKYTADGLAYCKFSIDNSQKEFHDGKAQTVISNFVIKVWGKLAEICATYLKIGSKIIVSGKLTETSKDDDEKSRLVIKAQDVKFLPNTKKNNDVKEEEV